MTCHYIKGLVSAAIAICAFSAQAGVITTINLNGSAVSNAAHTENFDGGTAGSNITNQFSANGLTFKTLGDAGISLLSNSVCNNMSSGMSGKYLSMGQRYPCTGNTTLNAISLTFAGHVSELSWTGFNRTIGDGFTVEVLNNGVVVATDALNSRNLFNNRTVNITGLFDEIRFTEATVWQGFFGLDNFAWNTAAVPVTPTSNVPEPGIALLFGTGLIGMACKRRKANKL